MFRTLTRLTFAAALLTLLCTPAYAAQKQWASLSPMQKEALAPIEQEWTQLPEKQRQRLIATTKRYPQLTPEQKQLFLNRLTEWSKLTQEQRNRAREKYKAFSKVPPEKKEEVKRMVRQTETEKTSSSAASSVIATPAK